MFKQSCPFLFTLQNWNDFEDIQFKFEIIDKALIIIYLKIGEKK